MKRTKWIGIILVGVLSALTIILALRTDHKYHTERYNETCEKASAEKDLRNQLDSVSTKLQRITVQLDSINGALKETKKTGNRNMESKKTVS